MEILRRALSLLLSFLLIWTPGCQTASKGQEAGASEVQADSNENELPEDVKGFMNSSSLLWKHMIDEQKWRVFVEGENQDFKQVSSGQLEKAIKTTPGEKLWFVSPDNTNRIAGIRAKLVQTSDSTQIFALEAVDWNNKSSIIANQQVVIPATKGMTDDQIVAARAKFERSLDGFKNALDVFAAGGLGLTGVTSFKITICAVVAFFFFSGMSGSFVSSGAAYAGKSQYLIYFTLLLTTGVFAGCVYCTSTPSCAEFNN